MYMESPESSLGKPPRTLLPGSECLYLRLYCSENNGDYILRNIVYPFIQSNKNGNSFFKWFFIRYGDPNWHIRLRFFGTPSNLLNDVLPYFTSASDDALSQRRLYKVEIGTYQREIERYGGNEGILASESLFAIDSDAVLQLLQLCASNQMLNDRWKIALMGADKILNDFGFDIDKKLKLATNLSTGYEREFRVGSAFKDSLSTRFRTERVELTNLLDGSDSESKLQTEAINILDWRSKMNTPLVERIRSCMAYDSSSRGFDDIVCSAIHMHINRILRSTHRAQELIIYNFLQKLYRSARARS